MSGGEKAVEIYLTALAPEILGIPIVQFALDEIVQYVGQIISVAGQHFATQVVIDLQTRGEKSDVITTAVALQIALASGNQEAIDGASQNLKDSYARLIHWDGSAQSR